MHCWGDRDALFWGRRRLLHDNRSSVHPPPPVSAQPPLTACVLTASPSPPRLLACNPPYPPPKKHPTPFQTPTQYATQKESEEESKANGTAADATITSSSSSNGATNGTADAAAAAETDAGGKPVSGEMAAMLAVDSKRALTAAIRAQVGGVQAQGFARGGGGLWPGGWLGRQLEKIREKAEKVLQTFEH